MSPKREEARAFGTAAEWVAAGWLRLKGYRILARQFRARGGEIDIVALTPYWNSPRTITFIEVRARGTREQAIQSVTFTKRQRIESSVSQFLSRYPSLSKLPRRYDLIVIGHREWPKHLTNVWS